MSYYSLSRIGDLPEILTILQVDPSPITMIDRFLAESADSGLLELLQDIKDDIEASEAGGETGVGASLSRIADACQGIEDKAQVSVQVSTDLDGTVVRVETEGSAVEYP